MFSQQRANFFFEELVTGRIAAHLTLCEPADEQPSTGCREKAKNITFHLLISTNRSYRAVVNRTYYTISSPKLVSAKLPSYQYCGSRGLEAEYWLLTSITGLIL
jgi:hypothetical protein